MTVIGGRASLISMLKRSRMLHDRDWWLCINDFHAQTIQDASQQSLVVCASLISTLKRSRMLHDRDWWSCINDFHAQTIQDAS